VKEKLCKVALEIKELEKLSKCLGILKKSAPEDEWVLRCEVINTKKVIIFLYSILIFGIGIFGMAFMVSWKNN
jgi:hypothetical protein